MTSPGVAIVGAAETAEIGTVAASSLALATDAARRALEDCGLTPADVDGVASSGLHPYLPSIVAHSLGIEARWVRRHDGRWLLEPRAPPPRHDRDRGRPV